MLASVCVVVVIGFVALIIANSGSLSDQGNRLRIPVNTKLPILFAFSDDHVVPPYLKTKTVGRFFAMSLANSELKGGVVAPPYQSWQYAKSNGRAALRGRRMVNPGRGCNALYQM
jgi:hypothetical protein